MRILASLPTMKIVLAPQALKGSLDAAAVGQAMADGVRLALPDAEIAIIPVADGGEGTVRALVAATGGQLLHTQVTGPLGAPVEAEWGLLGAQTDAPDEKTAVIEMAAAAGLPLVPPGRRDPRVTTTRGVGELLRAALDAGCGRILIGIGGSATNDGGAGMAQALGARPLDADGNELPPGGAALAKLTHFDLSGMDARLAQTRVLVACDVTNPLTGPQGASWVYGPQKGATPEIVRELDAALAQYADILQRELGVDVAETPGAGAAGGLGAGLLAFARAELVPGARLVFEALRFDERIAEADLIFTAEGRLDAQTAYGKAVGAVAAAGRRQGVPVVALAGAVAIDDAALRALGLAAALPLASGPLTLEESMTRAADLTRDATVRAMRLILLLK
jgi:glycerate 2-kinase